MRYCQRKRRAFVALFCAVGVAASGSLSFPTFAHLTSGELLNPQSKGGIPAGVNLRAIYPSGIHLTKISEGWIPNLYDDAAKYCTIGYGHLVKKAPCDGSEPVEFRNGLTLGRGEQILLSDLASSQYSVMTSVRIRLTDGQFAALADFVFNVGSSNFRQSTLLTVVNQSEFDYVPDQFRRWILAGGKRWDALATRRDREIDLFFDGLPKKRGPVKRRFDLSQIDIREGERP
jgi:lysozyme